MAWCELPALDFRDGLPLCDYRIIPAIHLADYLNEEILVRTLILPGFRNQRNPTLGL